VAIPGETSVEKKGLSQGYGIKKNRHGIPIEDRKVSVKPQQELDVYGCGKAACTPTFRRTPS
jgi:hypothetical protein